MGAKVRDRRVSTVAGRIGLEAGGDVPARAPGEEGVRFVPVGEFMEVEEDTAEPLLGTAEETVIPAGGLLLMYGDGGAGKTTLSIDAACHLAAGSDWLNIAAPRPAKILVIENEGPRAKFRQMLRAKSAGWNGQPDFTPNMHILEEPWTKFTLQDDEHRLALASTIDQLELDVVLMGPLVTLGVIGGGTPEDILTFETLMRMLRSETLRSFAMWLLHHENKAGDVSGAWERVPDTLVHVQAQGNGHTRVYWRKVRWSSERHGTTMNLTWSENRGYAVAEQEQRDLHAEILQAFAESDEWRTAKEVSELIGARLEGVREALSDLTERGELMYEKGPEGRHANSKCWRLMEQFPF